MQISETFFDLIFSEIYENVAIPSHCVINFNEIPSRDKTIVEMIDNNFNKLFLRKKFYLAAETNNMR